MKRLAEYLKEREGFESILTDWGFASYRISGDECYIRDIYVCPEFRKNNIASEMADQIEKIALHEGCKFLSGSVCLTAKNATTSTKVLLAYGFQIHSVVQNGILFRKDI